MPEILNGLERREVTNALTLWWGFAAFCEDLLGLDALKVLTVVLEPGISRIRDLEATPSALTWSPTPSRLRRSARGWPRRSGGPKGGAVGRFRGRLRKLEREVETEFVTLEHEDGTVSRWPLGDEGFKEVFVHEYERWTQDDPGPAHPFVVALRPATNLEALMSEHGTVLGLWLGEDEIIRGLRERPGPPVRESSPGVCE